MEASALLERWGGGTGVPWCGMEAKINGPDTPTLYSTLILFFLDATSFLLCPGLFSGAFVVIFTECILTNALHLGCKSPYGNHVLMSSPG